ncbi:MAG TPA: UPF0175 family protein [Candidatus Nanoarchaeia archaeon]|nr:UPF0175 family protein [Candidatus Nanoarchaeia archaeon]
MVKKYLADMVIKKEEKVEYALDKYRKKELSLARAAEITGIPLADMLKIAAEQGIPIQYTKHHLLRDLHEA